MKKAAVFLWALALWIGVTAQALAANAFNVDANGNVSATSLVTLAVSITGNLSTSTINGLVPSFSGSPSWTSIVGVPAGVVNISNSTGSITVTTVSASAYTGGSLTASGVVSANTLDSFFISGTSIAGVSGNFSGLTINGTLSMTGATNTITATNVYASSVSSTVGTFGSIGSGPQTASGLITAQAGLTVTGAITATTSIQGATISATTALYTAAISASGLASLNTVSTSGVVSNSATYSNYMREGLLAVTASTATTFIPLNVATGISLTLTSNTTISFTNVANAQANVAVMKIEEDSTGGRALTWPANARYNGNVTPTLTTTANTFSQCTAAPIPGSINILIGCPATGVSN